MSQMNTIAFSLLLSGIGNLDHKVFFSSGPLTFITNVPIPEDEFPQEPEICKIFETCPNQKISKWRLAFPLSDRLHSLTK